MFRTWFMKKLPPAIYSIVTEEHLQFYQTLRQLQYISNLDFEGIKLLMSILKDNLLDDFSKEEVLMEDHHYSEMNVHILHHKMVLEIIDRYSKSIGILDKDEVIAHIRSWMVLHTKHSDKRLQRYLFDVNRRYKP